VEEMETRSKKGGLRVKRNEEEKRQSMKGRAGGVGVR